MKNLSYWELTSFLGGIDIAIIGGGIVGLSAALEAKKRFPKDKIVVFEKGVFPSGASTKNAGFACFGSLTEILDDLKILDEEKVLTLIKLRKDGLNELMKNVPKNKMDFKNYGGYEVFKKEDLHIYDYSLENLTRINKLIKPIFGENVFELNKNPSTKMGMKKFNNSILNKFESQIDTGKMMLYLQQKVQKSGVIIYNGIEVKKFTAISENKISLHTEKLSFDVKKLIIANNAFAKHLLPDEDIIPARAQVLVTEPVKNLKLRGTFHYDKGYCYFRNINNRILLGGARNINFSGEKTYSQEITTDIQAHLEQLLHDFIFTTHRLKIDYRWTGTMGLGQDRFPIIKRVDPNISCAVKLGGMGVAIGSIAGKKAANLIH